MKTLNYNNGPLPEFLSSAAYITSSGKEFALPAKQALEYLGWCRSNGLKVLGYDAWKPTVPGPTALVGPDCEGDADTCEAAIQSCVRERGDDLVFNIWIAAMSENNS